METFDIYHSDKNIYEFAEEPLVIQSEYYNVSFQNAIEKFGDKIDLKQLLTLTAHEVVYSQFSKHFKKNDKLVLKERKKIVEDYFSHCGFGDLSLSSITNKGGYVELNSDHYAKAWIKHFGERPKTDPGVGYFTIGFLCGVIDAIFDVNPGTFDGKQSYCLSRGDDKSRFDIFRGLKKKLNASPLLGKFQEEDGNHDTATSDENVINQVRNSNLSGVGTENGLIEEFGITWTKHYANYFSMIIIKLLMQAQKKLGKGSILKINSLLSESSEKDAYFTFGKLMNSDFWSNQILPNIEADHDGPLKACLEIMAGFGHGKWKLVANEGNDYTFDITNNPETNAFLKLVGNTKSPIGFTSIGYVKGLINLNSQESTPSTFNNAMLDQLVSESKSYTCKESESRMVGAEKDTLVIHRA